MRIERPVLQVALDFENLSRALAAATEAVEGGADWIEAGTPLIKSEGLDAVRALKKAFPDRRIVADMKVMDTGAFEVEIAAKAGANVVTVLGAADDDTIAEAVRGGELYGAEVMVDLLGVPDPVARSRRAAELGAGAVCWHVGSTCRCERTPRSPGSRRSPKLRPSRSRSRAVSRARPSPARCAPGPGS